MDSRIDFLHDFKKRVLNGHRAMEPLSEDDEDAPYPSPRDITGLPEPIPGEAYWIKRHPVSARSDSGESVSGSDASSSSGSWCSVEPENGGENILSKPRTDSRGSSLQDDEEYVEIFNDQMQSENDELRFKVDQLNRHIDKLHYENDDCMNRILILQCSVERADEEADFYKKLYEATRSKGKDYIEKVPPIDGVKKVRYQFGKKVEDPSPAVVDPVVKAMVDERLQPITCVSPEDQLLESDNGQEESHSRNENKKALSGFNEKVSTGITRNKIDEYMDMDIYNPCTTKDGYSTCKPTKSLVVMDTVVVSSNRGINQNDVLDICRSMDDYTACKPMKTPGPRRSPLLLKFFYNTNLHCISPSTCADSISHLLKETTVERNYPTVIEDIQICPKGLNESENEREDISIQKLQRVDAAKHVEEIKTMDDDSPVPLDSSFVVKYTIADASTMKKAFCYNDSLGKYAKLPPVGAVPNLPTQRSQQFKSKKLKPIISSSEGTTHQSQPMPSFAKTVTMPRPTRASAMKAKDTSMKISKNQTLLPKHLPPTDYAVVTRDKRPSLPKIKSGTSTDKNKLQENLNVMKKVNATPLPNLLKPVQTLPRIYKPKPPLIIKQTKRPYTGKNRKLPPLDLRNQ